MKKLLNKETVFKRKRTNDINKLIIRFNQENDEEKREDLMEKIGEYGWN